MRKLAIEGVGFYTTAPGTSYTNATICTGNTNVMRDCRRAIITDIWGDVQGTAAMIKLTAPELHDPTNGIVLYPVASVVTPLRDSFGDVVPPQTTVTVQMQGSATGGDIENGVMVVIYEDPPFGVPNFLTADELAFWGEKELSIPNTISTGTAGDWSGSEAINAEVDQFKANRYYALAGAITQVECAGIRYVGPDFGNLGFVIPGDPDAKVDTRSYPVQLSRRLAGPGGQRPTIPVINSANKSSTFISALQDENGADPIVNTRWILLRPDFDPNNLQ